MLSTRNKTAEKYIDTNKLYWRHKTGIIQRTIFLGRINCMIRFQYETFFWPLQHFQRRLYCLILFALYKIPRFQLIGQLSWESSSPLALESPGLHSGLCFVSFRNRLSCMENCDVLNYISYANRMLFIISCPNLFFLALSVTSTELCVGIIGEPLPCQ